MPIRAQIAGVEPRVGDDRRALPAEPGQGSSRSVTEVRKRGVVRPQEIAWSDVVVAEHARARSLEETLERLGPDRVVENDRLAVGAAGFAERSAPGLQVRDERARRDLARGAPTT